MRTRSTSKPGTRIIAGNSRPWEAAIGLTFTLLCLVVLFGYANAGEKLATNSESVAAEKSTTVSPVVKEYLCGGCDDNEGLNSECRIGGDICLERKEVRQFFNVKGYEDLKQEVPQASESQFVLLVYMVDYLFHDGEHLSNENLAALADQDICAEINIDCLSQTVSRVLNIDAATLEPSTR